MPTFDNLESLASVRQKINDAIVLAEETAVDLAAEIGLAQTAATQSQGYATVSQEAAATALSAAAIAQAYGTMYTETDLELSAVAIPANVDLVARICATAGQVAPEGQLSWWIRNSTPGSDPYFTTSGGVTWTEVGLRSQDILAALNSAIAALGTEGQRIYATRAAAVSALTAGVPATVTRVGWYTTVLASSNVETIFVVKAPGATAWTVAGWVPEGDVTPYHWADNTTPGTTDMSAALQAAADYMVASGAPVDHGGGTVWIKGETALYSEVNVVGNNITVSGDGRAGTQIVVRSLTGNVIKFGSESASESYECAIRELTFVVPPNTVRTSGAFVQFRNVSGGGSFNVNYNGFYGAIDIVGSAHLIISNTWLRGRNRNGAGNVAEYGIQIDDDPVTGRGTTGIYINKIDGVASNSITLGWVKDFLIVRSCDGCYVTDFHANLAEWGITLAPHDDAFMGEFRMQGFYIDKSKYGNFRIVGNTTQTVRTVYLANGLLRAAGGGPTDTTVVDAEAVRLDVGADGLDIFSMNNVRIDAPQGRAINTLTANITDQLYTNCVFEDVNQGNNVGFNELELQGRNIRLDQSTFIRGSASTNASINATNFVSLKTGIIHDTDSSVTTRVVNSGVGVESGVVGWSGSRTPRNENWDTIAKNTLMVNNDAGAVGVPSAVTNWLGMHLQQTSAIATQLAFRPDDFRFRRLTSGVWGSWRRVYHSGNLLGTVSQSAGVPTGAVIERGSNANGEYVRFADGTQICTKRITLTGVDITTAYGALFSSPNLLTGVTTYPATFTAAPTCNITVHVEGLVGMQAVGGTGDANNTPANAYAVYHLSLTGRTVHVNVTATGRWF